MKSDSLQGIIPFVRVVEAGSFKLAAERLRLTTSAVGKSIAQMEQRLGVRLLNRSTRSLSLTSEGEAYFKACTAALSEIDAAQAQLAAHRGVPSGRLEDRSAAGVRPALRCADAVRSRWEISRTGAGGIIQRPALGRDRRGPRSDIRMGELGNEAGLVARKLFVQRSALCASPAYLTRRGVPADVDDLARHTLAVYGREGVITPWLLRDRAGRSRTLTPRGGIVLGHGEPLLDAALAGLGIAYLPTWLIHDRLMCGELMTVWPGGFVDNISVHALWPKTRSLTPKVRVVVDALAERFSPPPWDQA
jgi:DNA-binding transcriptional LysR family regulator